MTTQGGRDELVQNPTWRSQVCHLGRKLPGTIQHFKGKFMTKGCIPSGHGESTVPEARAKTTTQVLYATALYTTNTVYHRHCMPLHCMPQALHATALHATVLYATGTVCYYSTICHKYTVCHYIVCHRYCRPLYCIPLEEQPICDPCALACADITFT